MLGAPQKSPDAWASGLGQTHKTNGVIRLPLVLERNADERVASTYSILFFTGSILNLYTNLISLP